MERRAKRLRGRPRALTHAHKHVAQARGAPEARALEHADAYACSHAYAHARAHAQAHAGADADAPILMLMALT
eukprot:4885909-Pleurochrysis_carterae.AAC.1